MAADPKTTPRSSGRAKVTYRHIDGGLYDAVVEGGTGTSLNLFVPHLPAAQRHKTAIAKRTNRTGTNVWK